MTLEILLILLVLATLTKAKAVPLVYEQNGGGSIF